MDKHNKIQERDDLETDKVINLPEKSAKKDPAGTDPNRYENFASDKGKGNNDTDYDKKPDNHPSSGERLLNPDKGEK